MIRRFQNTRPKRVNHYAGVSMVEMAIVAPVFLMILFAGIEFSRICIIRNAANNAAYQAARQVMVPGATVADAQAEADRLLGILGVKTFTLSVTPDPITSSSERVTVSISIPAKDNGWMVALFSKDLTLKAGSTLFTERDTVY